MMMFVVCLSSRVREVKEMRMLIFYFWWEYLVVLLLTFIELRGDSSRVANNKLKIGDVSVIHHPSHHLQSIIYHPSSIMHKNNVTKRQTDLSQ
jgi:hypothetical protein